MQWQTDVDLAAYTTLRLPARAERFWVLHDEAQLAEVCAHAEANDWPLYILGGGSNLVVRDRVPGLVVQMALRGIRRCAEWSSPEQVVLEAAAGESWHEFTQTTVAQNLCGLENLSLIPGSVGAAPVQNIGAYGVEIKDVLHSVRAYDREQHRFVELLPADCHFAYRDSVFKSHQPGRYVITAVRFAFPRTRSLQLDYGDIRAELTQQGHQRPTPMQVAEAVMAIRRRKLPDPAQLANAGSFFKNPWVPSSQVQALKQQYPNLVAYPASVEQPEWQKVAAGWLIEHAGWKGYRRDGVGVHAQQALVLVHEGGSDGAALLALAADIVASVQRRFGIQLEQEPVIWP